MKSVVAAICVALLTAASALAAPRIDEWRYTPAAEGAPATATNLLTGLTAHCDLSAGELVIRYALGPEVTRGPYEIWIRADDRDWPMRVAVDGRKLEGRMASSVAFAEDVAMARQIEFSVTTPLREPLHTGDAQAFRRVVADCR